MGEDTAGVDWTATKIGETRVSENLFKVVRKGFFRLCQHSEAAMMDQFEITREFFFF